MCKTLRGLKSNDEHLCTTPNIYYWSGFFAATTLYSTTNFGTYIARKCQQQTKVLYDSLLVRADIRRKLQRIEVLYIYQASHSKMIHVPAEIHECIHTYYAFQGIVLNKTNIVRLKSL